MAWKVEKWLSEVFPGPDRIYEEYRHLPRRELAIVAAAVLDVALGELLSLRLLKDSPTECEEFLGLNADGRAPCASFGARIQLALLIGIITPADASMLRFVKNIRNKLAHRVRADYTSPEVLPLVIGLHDAFIARSNALIDAAHLEGPRHDPRLLRPLLDNTPEAGAGLLLAVLTIYQAYFHRISGFIARIPFMPSPSSP
jgi:hypothetical protein